MPVPRAAALPVREEQVRPRMALRELATDRPAAGRPIGCELPKGHPGPHLYFADLERCGAGEEDPALAS